MAHGHIETPSRFFQSKPELRQAGVHRNTQGGIGGGGNPGVESVVLSGGYEDDVDNGDTILYTGMGGRDSRTGQQIADQEFLGLNRSLVFNVRNGMPVRVVRKLDDGRFSYDGLYQVVDAYDVLGQRGFRICRYELVKVGDDTPADPEGLAGSTERPRARRMVTTERVVRDTGTSQRVKRLHDYRCQVCGTALATKRGLYAEGAHVIPLGKPFDGPDTSDNILCLCPNHHVLLDHGGLYVTDSWDVRSSDGEVIGVLQRLPKHPLRADAFQAHRERFGHPNA